MMREIFCSLRATASAARVAASALLPGALRRLWLVAAFGLLPASMLAAPPPGSVAARHDPVPHQDWSFNGPLGNFDTATLQRGYAVYAQVCSRCHGMEHVKFADLAGIGLTQDQIAAIASTHMILDGKDARGRPVIRAARADDFFPAPPITPGALPVPDQSHLALVYPGGPDRVYALITGYRDAPAGRKLAEGMYYNPFALDYAIGMPPPLQDGSVQYADGTPATMKQEARDVTTFLYWVAQPHLADRHRYGVRVVLYLLFLAVLLVILKRRVWSNVR